jgi:signal peptide peptidase SppA
MKLIPWRAKRIPVVELHGVLASKGPLNIEAVGPLIERAFKAAGKGGTVLLDIESPGGSPVQSALIAARIRRHAEETKAKVRAVIAEVGASGGYWVACAADEIIAHPMSIVGSIGVIGGGFGFDQAIARLSIERRLYTAGENKARLDPFSPERPEDVAFTRQLLDDLHAQFKSWVRERRTGRLKTEESKIFDGSYMLGDQALSMGLVDRLGDLEAEVRNIGGKKAKSDVMKPKKRGLLSRIPGLALVATLEALEERSWPTLR